jgi:phage-related minor tail protein
MPEGVMNKLDPYFGRYTGATTADADNSISRIRAEVSRLSTSATILEQIKHQSASLARTDLRKLAEQMRETADMLDRVVDRIEVNR